LTLHSQKLAPDWKIAEVIPVDIEFDLGLRLREGNEVITPDSDPEVEVYRDSGAADLYTSGTATKGETSLFALGAVPSATEALSSDWLIVWRVFVGGLEYVFRRRAVLVGMPISPRVSDEDLYSEKPDLAHPSRLPIGQEDWSKQILEGWYDVVRDLTRRGKKPWLAVDLLDLYRWHKKHSLARACAAVPSEAGGHYAEEASRFRNEASVAALECDIEYAAESQIAPNVGRSVIPCAPIRRSRW
jgi:hypothetical protein